MNGVKIKLQNICNICKIPYHAVRHSRLDHSMSMNASFLMHSGFILFHKFKYSTYNNNPFSFFFFLTVNPPAKKKEKITEFGPKCPHWEYLDEPQIEYNIPMEQEWQKPVW